MAQNEKFIKRCVLLLVIMLVSSCTTFMLEEQERDLLTLDGKTATMKKEHARDNLRLDKGQKVKLHLLIKDDSIRVYAYPAEVEFLKSKRLLVLHLFDEDFKDSRFNKSYFLEKLNEVVILDNKVDKK